MWFLLVSILLFSSDLVYKTNGFLVDRSRPSQHSLCAATEPIDPLFNDRPISKKRRVLAPSMKKKVNRSSKSVSNKAKKGLKSELSDAEIDKVLLEYEGQLLNFLPLELMNLFDIYLNKLVPKVSAMALIIHVMMLIPLLKAVVINQLHQSIVSYLYLGPITIALPFLMIRLFDKEIYDSAIVREMCFTFISAQQDRAKETLEKNRAYLYGVLEEVIIGSTLDDSSNKSGEGRFAMQHMTMDLGNNFVNDKEEEGDDILRNVASARLLSKVDAEFFTREVLSLKRVQLSSKGKGKAIMPSDGVSVDASANTNDNDEMKMVTTPKQLIELASLSAQVNIGELTDLINTEKGIHVEAGQSSLTNGVPYVDAALLLIKNLKLKYADKSDEEILVELKKLLEAVERKDENDGNDKRA